jgi:hypothetical protein
MDIIVGAIGALFGGLVTFLVGRIEHRRLARRGLTLDLYQAWNSDEVHRARVSAETVLKSNKNLDAPRSYRELQDELLRNGNLEDWIAVNRVLHFHRECGVLLRVGAIDRKLLYRLLGHYFEYWIDSYLEPLSVVSRQRDSDLVWDESLVYLRSALDRRYRSGGPSQ